MEDQTLFLQYANAISNGRWESFLESQPTEGIISELEPLCHAALLSRNSEEALQFLEAMYQKLSGSVPPEQAGFFLKIKERAESVVEVNHWQEITEQKAEMPLKPVFPVGTFPPVIETYLDNVAKRNQVQREMVYPAALASLALCVQGKFKVEYPDATGHRQHLCLYIGIVAESSERKSPVFQQVFKKPFWMWYSGIKETYEAEKAHYSAERKVLQRQLDAAEKDSTKKGKAETAVEDIAGLEGKLASLKPPRNPYFYFSDITPEALAVNLRETGESGGIFSEEGDFMEIIAGRYAEKGKSSNAELVLKAYNGEVYRSNRISREELMLERPLLSMCLMLQPDLYQRIATNQDLQGRGVIPRFLFSVPEKRKAPRKAINNEILPLVGEDAYHAIIWKFLDLDLCEEQEIPVLKFAPELCQESSGLGKHLQWIENTIGENGIMEKESAYAGKAGGKLIRIAGILHLLWGYDQHTPISEETANRAVQIHEFFFGEKLKEMQARENREEQIVQRVQRSLLRHTVEKGLAYIPQRAFYMKVKGKDLNNMEHFRTILETLEERSVLQVQRSGNKYLIYVSPFLF